MPKSNAERQAAWRSRQAERTRAVMAGRTPPAPAIGTMPAVHRWKALQEQARNALQQLLDEQQAYYDERTEEWQESERGQDLLDQIETLDSLIEDLGRL